MPPADHDHEAALGRAALRVVAWLALPVVGIAGAMRGIEGAGTALGGLALVGLGQYVTGRTLSWAARRSHGLLMGVTLFGFLARLGVYALLIITLSSSPAVDAPSLVGSVVVAVVAVLALETRLVLQDGSFWWLQSGASAPTATNPTASAAVTAKELA